MWGDPSPVVSEQDCIERRGGRIIPSVEASWSDLTRLKVISTALSQRANQLLSFDKIDYPMPRPEHLARIDFDEGQGCWRLPISPSGERRRDTYGRLRLPSVPNPSSMAHRTMYKVYFGLDSLPNGRSDVLDHVCETKPCCNPRHLERVSHGENTRRGRVLDHGIESLLQ
ncbi:MAG: hypothetical protein WAR37_04165 [Candidatus Microsaccharimonas sp.]